ncbi:MAG: T9SS type A sorting domain-containing protein [Patescibacteria group bacterium]|nr:T9SS type A sorting domain-containing protein [Patescibacteria group bacterium]
MKSGICIAAVLLALLFAVSAQAEYSLRNSSVSAGTVAVSSDSSRLVGSVGWVATGKVSQEPWVIIQGLWTPSMEIPSAIGEESLGPYAFALGQNYPNPFKPRTTIQFVVPGTGGENVKTRLVIFDVTGRRVKSLVTDALPAGPHRVEWFGLDENGQPVSSGVYFCRLWAGKNSATKRLIVLK